jgi:hypothetical protein
MRGIGRRLGGGVDVLEVLVAVRGTDVHFAGLNEIPFRSKGIRALDHFVGCLLLVSALPEEGALLLHRFHLGEEDRAAGGHRAVCTEA